MGIRKEYFGMKSTTADRERVHKIPNHSSVLTNVTRTVPSLVSKNGMLSKGINMKFNNQSQSCYFLNKLNFT